MLRKWKDNSKCDCGCDLISYSTVKIYNEKTFKNEIELDRIGCPDCLKEIVNDGDLKSFLSLTIEYSEPEYNFSY